MATSNSNSMATAPPRPPSPGLGAVPLSSAIDDLLRFVLATRAADPDDSGLSLSPAYCTRLLDDGDLFAKLAAGLVQCVEEGRMPSPPAVVGVPVAEDDGSDEREKEWEALLLEKGAELKQMYDAVDFGLHVQEPYFTQLRAETKTVEGRLATGNYNRIIQGSLLLFNKCLLLNVEALRKYSSFSEMLQTEMIAHVLPGISSVEEGCSLTDVARALGKHVHRSSEGWWGRFNGSDSSKNRLAFEAIECLLRECCWMNVHLTQPYGAVFEIRVPEGYGARWSQDGSKFIGFLEPYTPEGFSKGWNH